MPSAFAGCYLLWLRGLAELYPSRTVGKPYVGIASAWPVTLPKSTAKSKWSFALPTTEGRTVSEILACPIMSNQELAQQGAWLNLKGSAGYRIARASSRRRGNHLMRTFLFTVFLATSFCARSSAQELSPADQPAADDSDPPDVGRHAAPLIKWRATTTRWIWFVPS